MEIYHQLTNYNYIYNYNYNYSHHSSITINHQT